LIETLLPQLTLAPQTGLDPRQYFSVADPPPPWAGEGDRAKRGGGGTLTDIWLEIGFGGGEHLAWQAEHHPEIGLIGAEPFVAGMAKLLSKIDGSDGGNIRLYTEDARDIVAALPDASLGRMFILFPDPWPKTRHHKRRLIQMDLLSQFARVLRPGAELRFATDDPGYLAYALERLMAHPDFAWTAGTAADWRGRPADWPETRYEAKALAAGRACIYLRFVRV
jgi:tRNA (guanine-N7-)-methyltransferase